MASCTNVYFKVYVKTEPKNDTSYLPEKNIIFTLLEVRNNDSDSDSAMYCVIW